MKLAEYLEREGLNASAFAERVGVPTSTISRLLRGKRQPGLCLMTKIAQATHDAVSKLDDFKPKSRHCLGR